MDDEFTIIIPSNRVQLAKECQESLFPLKSTIFDGSNYPSYSKIMNDVIISCPTEMLIVCNDKGRPKPDDVKEVVDLIKEGYGMVWLHPFGFGGFYKDLIRQIGFYDERFTDGNYEDCDMYKRLKENNIAIYERFKIKWIKLKSSWAAKQSKKHIEIKWEDTETTMKRLMPDEVYDYDIGKCKGRKFLSWDKSVVETLSLNFRDRVVL